MTYAANRARVLVGLLFYLATMGAQTADGLEPDAAFLEFLGDWTGTEEADEWLDFLERLPEPQDGDAGVESPDDRKADDESP